MLPTIRAVLLGEIEELFEAASRGQLAESADHFVPLKPVASDPHIWELRHRNPLAYRFYHGEPPRYPSLLVKLHRHIKDSRTTQQSEIDYAISRYYPKEGYNSQVVFLV